MRSLQNVLIAELVLLYVPPVIASMFPTKEKEIKENASGSGIPVCSQSSQKKHQDTILAVNLLNACDKE
jgi:hypothetical protein